MRIDRVSFRCECGEEFEAPAFDNVVSFDCPNCNQERMFGLIVDDYRIDISNEWEDDFQSKPAGLALFVPYLFLFIFSFFFAFLLFQATKKEPIHTTMEGNTFSNVENTVDRPLIEVRP